jgi:hypothetical protein
MAAPLALNTLLARPRLPQVGTRDGFDLWRIKMPVPQASDRLYAEEAILLPLEVREGPFRFAGERFLKATGQSLIEGAARFRLVAGL